MKHGLFAFYAVCISCIPTITFSYINQSHLYHARLFPGENRFAYNNLSSLTFQAAGDSTTKRLNNQGETITAPSGQRRYRYHQSNFIFEHNFSKNIFAGFNFPYAHLIIEESDNNISYKKKFINNPTFNVGWTQSSQCWSWADFVNFTVESGLVIPAESINSNAWGMPLSGKCALGIYDWVTLGVQSDVTIFSNKHNKACWNLCTYFKADHLMRGLSLLLGYSYSTQEKTPTQWETAPSQQFTSWNRWTCHFALSYDFACTMHPHAPHIEFCYNKAISGKNIIDNSLIGFQLGAEF